MRAKKEVIRPFEMYSTVALSHFPSYRAILSCCIQPLTGDRRRVFPFDIMGLNCVGMTTILF